MTPEQLQAECEKGQSQLMEMQYLDAEATLASAEQEAWARRDWDTLSRLYMPLQEARRQRRQRCGEGIVCLDLVSEGANDVIDPVHVLKNYPHGQLLAGGWGTTEPARRVRAFAEEHKLFVDTFLAAAYPGESALLVAILPLPIPRLPDATPRSVAELQRVLPPNTLIFRLDDLPRGSRRGTYETYGQVMALWEQLHAPFLAAADAEPELMMRMEGYRTAIEVDYACELAHQKLSAAARLMLRSPSIAESAGVGG